MAKTFEEFVKESKEKNVTITEAEFHSKAAEVMASGKIEKLIHIQPIILLTLTAFTCELSTAIFDKKDNESEE